MPDSRKKTGRRASFAWASKQKAYKVLSAAETVRELFAGLGRPWQGRLKELWRHWDLVAGAEIARLGRPLGQQDKTLLLGVEDAMALQELSMQRDEILERTNAFMNENFFLDLKVRLRQDQVDLSTR
ncbi:MAG: DUF721 domain-containing protein [Desulfovibrio sp.]|jgi:hypothetical protein|nr:DUF721 domain-containing protein [Desulfovibrio sp.]